MSKSELIYQALMMWSNYIETGNVNLSARDFVRRNKVPKALDENQIELIGEIKNLALEVIGKEVILK